jgi:hypothetical protein
VLSPATLAALQQLRAKSRFAAAHGTMYYDNGQHYMSHTTEERSAKQKAAFEEWMRSVENNTSVITVAELAALDPKRRGELEKMFGRDGVEAALLALAPGHVLWTDDFVFAEVAKSELGVERVWTQAMVEHLANRGLIDRALADEAHAKLVGFDYQCTHFTGTVMVAALRASNGSVDAFPVHQMIRAFAPLRVTNRDGAMRLLAEFILRLTLDPMLPETRCIATKAFLDTFPTDASTTAQLLSFRSQCARLMTLNPLSGADFLQCFDQWRKQRLMVDLYR